MIGACGVIVHAGWPIGGRVVHARCMDVRERRPSAMSHRPNPASTTSQLRAAWKHRGGPQPRTVKRFSPEKSNSAFDACYRGHVVPEAEWETFIATLRSPLPSTFSFVHTGCASVDPALVQARFEEHCLPQLAIPDGGDDAGVLVAAGVRVIVRLQCMRSGGARAFLRSEAVAAPRRVRPLPWFPAAAAGSSTRRGRSS